MMAWPTTPTSALESHRCHATRDPLVDAWPWPCCCRRVRTALRLRCLPRDTKAGPCLGSRRPSRPATRSPPRSPRWSALAVRCSPKGWHCRPPATPPAGAGWYRCRWWTAPRPTRWCGAAGRRAGRGHGHPGGRCAGPRPQQGQGLPRRAAQPPVAACTDGAPPVRQPAGCLVLAFRAAGSASGAGCRHSSRRAVKGGYVPGAP